MVKNSNDIEAIYNAALEKEAGRERSKFLDASCGKNSVVRARVEALLKAHDEVGDFLESPILDPAVTLDDSPISEGPGTIIGRYKLLEKIGEGGMAVVYMAEQEKPLRRRVALKIIKLGMDTKSVIARFEVERQALAVMDHPNIAKVFDAGTTETGRPYFVMELVRGVSISTYCDKNKLDTKERLYLFVQVCNAVQHAHQKGIIHRDIKPSNVMVTLRDGKPVPKVIDFGIAKATSQRLTEKTLFTRYAQMIGTPAYMSPEQAEFSEFDIDTRTDIYSLGVLLYELLTGATPFSEEQLREAGYLEMQRIIREEEPAKPSTKLTTLGEQLTDVAEHRKTEPALLTKLIRGDLDWIVMKSLEKDRIRRYATATGLAADIGRHFNSEPVLAAAPTVSYRLRKFVRRNRALVTGVTAVLVVLIAGVVVSTLFAIGQAHARAEADHQRQVAEQRRTEAIDARDEARRQARLVQALIPFQGWDLYPSLHTWGGMAREVTVNTALANVSRRLEREFEGPPLLEASLRGSIGMSLQSIGEYDAAELHLQRAWKLRKEQLGEDDLSTLVSQTNLASLYMKQGHYDRAESLLIKTIDKSSKTLGEKHVATLDSISVLERLLKSIALRAGDRYRGGAYQEALSDLTHVRQLRQTVLGSECPPREVASIAITLHQLGHRREAEATLGQLRNLFEDSKHYCQPYEMYLSEVEQALVDRKGKVNQVWEYVGSGKLQKALQMVEELRTMSRQKDVQIVERTQSVCKALARAYYYRGRNNYRRGGDCGETIADYETAVRVDPDFALALEGLAWLRAACAMPEFRDSTKAVEAASKACEMTNWKDYSCIGTLAASYARSGDFAAAVKWQRESLELLPEDKKMQRQDMMGMRLRLYEAGQPYHEDTVKPMIAWWEFDKAQGPNVIDSSGNGLHGTLMGEARIINDAERGNVLSLDGDSGYVDCGKHPLFDIVDEITVMAWIKPNMFDHWNWWQAIVTKGDSSWRIQRYHASDVLEFGCTGLSVQGNQFSQLVGTVSVNDGRWHHVAAVYDCTSVYLYVDGVLDSSERASGSIAINDEPVYIGGNSQALRTWDGLIDDVRIYNYALSEAEVKAISDDRGQIQTEVR